MVKAKTLLGTVTNWQRRIHCSLLDTHKTYILLLTPKCGAILSLVYSQCGLDQTFVIQQPGHGLCLEGEGVHVELEWLLGIWRLDHFPDRKMNNTWIETLSLAIPVNSEWSSQSRPQSDLGPLSKWEPTTPSVCQTCFRTNRIFLCKHIHCNQAMVAVWKEGKSDRELGADLGILKDGWFDR